jgi:Flp pilus assembly protein TadB
MAANGNHNRIPDVRGLGKLAASRLGVGRLKEVVMPLSEHEQKLLEQLEKQLHEDDPKFASSMGSDPGRSWSTRHLVIGVLATLAGVLLLLVGVTVQSILVGVLGFVVMGAGVYFATMRSSVAAKAKSGGNAKKSGKSRSSFMSNLEERWDERHRGEQ